MQPVQVWTMRTDGLTEAEVAPWTAGLDENERARAARTLFARDRIAFIAAHALTRAALCWVVGGRPAAWRFVPGAHGKPEASCTGARPVSFNLSHTAGCVGVAVVAGQGRALGFDLEQTGRRVNLAVADRYFGPQEVAWLISQPEPQRRLGFVRLWTLKEAFIKATGKGLSQDLASFWFDPCPPRLHVDETVGEDSAAWQFEQRLLDGVIAAVGWRMAADVPDAAHWQQVEAGTFDPG